MIHWRCVTNTITIALIVLIPALTQAREKADFVYVDKSDAKLYLSREGKIFKEYRVSLGLNPEGPKMQDGDNRTPEGLYMLDFKNERSDFHKSIHISYPNREDRRRASELGVNPGGDIMIHGLREDLVQYAYLITEFNWTNGCIALTNQDVEDLWHHVDVPIPIRIQP